MSLFLAHLVLVWCAAAIVVLLQAPPVEGGTDCWNKPTNHTVIDGPLPSVYSAPFITFEFTFPDLNGIKPFSYWVDACVISDTQNWTQTGVYAGQGPTDPRNWKRDRTSMPVCGHPDCKAWGMTPTSSALNAIGPTFYVVVVCEQGTGASGFVCPIRYNIEVNAMYPYTGGPNGYGGFNTTTISTYRATLPPSGPLSKADEQQQLRIYDMQTLDYTPPSDNNDDDNNIDTSNGDHSTAMFFAVLAFVGACIFASLIAIGVVLTHRGYNSDDIAEEAGRAAHGFRGWINDVVRRNIPRRSPIPTGPVPGLVLPDDEEQQTGAAEDSEEGDDVYKGPPADPNDDHRSM